jgi:bifunctional DNase/RNase
VTDPRGGHVAVPDPVVSEAGDTPVDAPIETPMDAPVQPEPVQPEPVQPDAPSPGSDGPAVADGATADAVASDPQLSLFSMALVSAVSVDLPNQHPTVVLRESESPRRQLSFSVGLPEAVVLSHAMRRIPTPRPLTPELLSGILQSFDVDVVAVRLVGRQGSIYFAELDLQGRSGRSVHSCRPSDALTVALLQPVPVPILIDRRLLDLEGDVLPPGPAPAG